MLKNPLFLIIFCSLSLLFSCSSHDSTDKGSGKAIGLISSSDLVSKKEYTSLVEALQAPDSVYKLKLSGLHLTTLPMDITRLTRLQELNIADNDFEVLPECIYGFQNLQELVCYGNKIKTLGEHIGQLKNLKMISAYDNLIAILPPEIGELENLEALILSHNKLTSLPKEMEKLHALKELNVSENQLSTLDFNLGAMPKLESIDVFENRFLDRDIDALRKKFPKIEIQNDDCVYNNDYQALSTQYLDSAGIKRKIWRGSDSTAIGFLENGDSVFAKIGGCGIFSSCIEWHLSNETHSLDDSVFWRGKALWLTKRMKDKEFERFIADHQIKWDNPTEPNMRNFSIIGKNTGIDSIDNGNSYPGFTIFKTGAKSRIIRYGYGMDL